MYYIDTDIQISPNLYSWTNSHYIQVSWAHSVLSNSEGTPSAIAGVLNKHGVRKTRNFIKYQSKHICKASEVAGESEAREEES